MPVDPKIKAAIVTAVREEGQSPALATKLVAWFDAVASGNERLDDASETKRHLSLLYDETECQPPDVRVPRPRSEFQQ